MRTKQFFYLCGIVTLACSSALSASAQYVVEEQVTVAELVPGKVHYYADSNLDNWYLSLGAGTQTFLSEHSGSDARFTLAMNLAVGKWITPYVGMRMSAMAGSLHFNWNENNEGSMKYGAFYLDFLWNMTNSVFGYSERRVLSIIPFVGLGGAYGWHHTGNNDKTWALPITGGIKFNFNLAHYVDFFIEGRVQAVGDQFNHVIAGSQVEWLFRLLPVSLSSFVKVVSNPMIPMSTSWRLPNLIVVPINYEPSSMHVVLAHPRNNPARLVPK